VSNKETTQEQGDAKLEDILKSIRGIIDNHDQVSEYSDDKLSAEIELLNESEQNHLAEEIEIAFELDEASQKHALDQEDTNVLELTRTLPLDEIDDEDSLISHNTKNKTQAELDRFAKKAKNSTLQNSSDSLEGVVNNLMQPLIKEWLDNNLLRIVEKVVTEEIRKMVPKS